MGASCGPRIVEHRKNRTIERHADERHHFRTVAADLSVQYLPGIEVFSRTELIDSRTGPRNQISDAEAPFMQPIVVFVRDRLRYQARIAQKFPESVRIPGEMMAGHRRPHAGIDADKQDTQAGPYTILQAQLRPT